MENFRKEFYDDQGNFGRKWIFENNGITIDEIHSEDAIKSMENGRILKCFCPYDRLSELEYNKRSETLKIQFFIEAIERTMIIGTEKCDVGEIKEAIRFALKQKKKSKKTTEFKRVQILKKVENNKFDSGKYIMQCQACGQVFYYTELDLERNRDIEKEAEKLQKNAIISSMVWNPLVGAVDSQRADNKLNTMVDYHSCPKCKSSKLKRISEEELNQIKEKENAPAITTTVSNADELKKFKELLDSGVITQEEFDAKKKQLLGL